ncbi:MAG TPA: HNH endonuclease signature motif containing protein [Rhodocyclaceae bacterium]|nr:HNH endonuclease signature motif containing protein [Rhodocyclaceae bacterium]
MATKPITQFFLDLELPLKNSRWSWGAQNENTVLLRTWADEFSLRDKRVVVLREPAGYQDRESYGLDERIRHLRTLWAGGVAGYSVIATAKATDVPKREIKEYRDDKIFVIDRLEARADGAIVAVLEGVVAVDELADHRTQHVTAPAEGPFPVDVLETGMSTDSYKAKLPAMRDWLIEVARRESYVTYADVMDRFGLIFFVLRTAMSKLGHQSADNNEPILTALIVDKETLRCSDGLADEFKIVDDQAERRRLYAYWALPKGGTVDNADPAPAAPAADPDSLEERAKRFALVEVRTQQGAFRKAVFLACRGRCVVSGCDIPEALEAAHLDGHSWKDGHNSAEDGVLLRRDLHALYDTGLLSFAEGLRVQLDPTVREHYGVFEGANVAAVILSGNQKTP